MNIKSTILNDVKKIVHGFGTLQEPVPLTLEKSWKQRKPKWHQVHGISLSGVTRPHQECGDVDGLYTAETNLPIGVETADCVPILLAHRDGRKVAAVHAGWRGTRARILHHLWKVFEKQGENPADWVAAVGPAIGPCCYEVSEELSKDFLTAFEFLGKGVAVPRHRILDLPAINAGELRALGFSAVDLIRMCTQCSTEPLFVSYRRALGKLNGQRQLSVIEIRP